VFLDNEQLLKRSVITSDLLSMIPQLLLSHYLTSELYFDLCVVLIPFTLLTPYSLASLTHLFWKTHTHKHDICMTSFCPLLVVAIAIAIAFVYFISFFTPTLETYPLGGRSRWYTWK